MKRSAIINITAITLFGLFSVQCEDKFANLNQNPNEITDPDVTQLLTDGLYIMCGRDQEYLQWFYDGGVYFWRCQQLTVSRAGTEFDFNTFGALGGVPLYEVMVDMKEIRYRIDIMSEEDQAIYKKFKALTYIPQVYLGIKATDWQGSMPYSEAIDARYTGNLTPRYDTQKELFTTWLKEMDDAITVLLESDASQISPENKDFIFSGDYTAWARLANTLRLRIAARLEYADPTWMKEILTSVLSKKDGDGNLLLITEADKQAIWAPGAEEMGPGGTNSLWIENYAPSQNFSKFMVANQDPRLGIFFVKNDLDDLAIDSLLATPDVTLPYFATKPVVEPWDRLIGAPVAPDSSSVTDYFGGTFTDRSGKIYSRLPYVDFNLIKPKQNNRAGEYKNYFAGAAEVCFYLAEFIEKGYITGPGTAKDWYEKGVRLSCENYNDKAGTAQVPDYATRQIASSQIDDLLTQANVQYIEGDPGNVEKIILQQIINLFDNPYEGVAVSRRTGYPKRTSTLWAWQPYTANGVEIPMPRRFPWATPTDATNESNWNAALTEQAFTADVTTFNVMNTERVWWDKNCPNFGNGQ